MVRFTGLALVLALVTAQAEVRAQPTYTIHFTKAGSGTSVLVEKENTQLKSVQVVDRNGKDLQNRREKSTDTVTYREAILVKEPGQDRPTHLQRKFERAQRQIGDRVMTIPVQGKVFDIEKKDGRYHFQYAGGEALPAEALPALEREFNSGLHEALDFEKLVLPTGPVHVNDAWDLDRQRVVQVLGKLTNMQIDADHATARAKLAQVVQQNGRPFAVLEADVDLPVKASIQGNTIQPLQPGSKVSLKLRLTGCIDGGPEAFTAQVDMQMAGASLMHGPNFSVVTTRVNYQSTVTEKRRQIQE